jgi:ureidoacrylate peracid hydrolase
MSEDAFKIIRERLQAGRTALLVVDVQNDFCHPEGAFAKKKADTSLVEPAIGRLTPFIDQCRRFAVPIVFVKTIHSEWTDSASWLERFGGKGREFLVCRENSWGAEFYRVEPGRTDCVVVKHRFSGFSRTDLDLILRSRGIETLLVAGVVTNVCVETTARDGFNLDYRIILVEDCCGPYFAEEHAATLRNISRYFGTVSDSGEIVGILEELHR